jgi:hypothetical protein
LPDHAVSCPSANSISATSFGSAHRISEVLARGVLALEWTRVRGKRLQRFNSGRTVRCPNPVPILPT